jgi:hypothetical protein
MASWWARFSQRMRRLGVGALLLSPLAQAQTLPAVPLDPGGLPPVAPLVRPVLPGGALLPNPIAPAPGIDTLRTPIHTIESRASTTLPLAASVLPPATIAISGNTAVATLALPQGLDAELTLSFEAPANLSAASLGISAELVNPLDLTLLARLPSPQLSIPTGFPVLITVEPPSAGGLSFVNAVSVELHTHALPYSVASPLRLYKAPLGGRFYDITDGVNPGSVRTRGQTGGFSQFLILVDTTDAQAAASDKYAYLDARLTDPAVSAAARTALVALLASSRAAFSAGDFVLASARLDSFRDAVRSYAGAGVPNRWRAARDLDNIAGDLLGESASLEFTLGRLAGP